MDFYCARLFIICLVNDGKLKKKHTCYYPFILFKAKDYAHAFARSLELGKQQETKYKNSDGQLVKWVFAEVEVIRCLGKSPDGVEVGSLLDVWKSDKPIGYRARFNPIKSKPLFE